MPANRNLRGGKGFKKGKKGGGDDEERRRFVGRAADQDYARVVRTLGNRRMLCFCNDGEERVCKIRGALCRGPKKQIIGVGDIVLITLRGFEAADSDDDGIIHHEGGSTTADPTGAARTLVSGRKEIGDIIGKYESRDFRHIRKEKGIHRMLLAGDTAVDDDIFDRDGSSDEDDGGLAGDDADVDIDAI